MKELIKNHPMDTAIVIIGGIGILFTALLFAFSLGKAVVRFFNSRKNVPPFKKYKL